MGVLGCGGGGWWRLGWVGDLGCGGGSGGCCVGSWSCVVFPGAVGWVGGVVGVVCDVDLVVEPDRASPQTLGASGQFATAYGAVAQQFSGRLSGTAALDAQLSGVVSDAAAADGAGRNQSGSVLNAAAGDTARTAPFTNTPAGQRALLVALRDRVDEQRQVISAYKARDARLAAMVRQLAYRRPGACGGGGMPGMLSGLGGMRAPTGGGGSGLGGLSMPNLSGLTRGRGDHNSSAPIGRLQDDAGGPLTRSSTPREVATRIIWEAHRRGYSREQAIAFVSTSMQENGLRPLGKSPSGIWEGLFQQDAGYPGRSDPNTNISEFFNRLGEKGGPQSPDIWKSIFWLQQRPGDPSADIAFARGRQGYLTEIQSQLPRARALYREITGT
jgi:hypothetical protein